MNSNLNILNATRVIIKRAEKWRTNSRLYHIEIRWDYNCKYSTFLWNNERDALPMATRGNAVQIPREHVAQLCSKLGLMYKSRFERDINNDIYLEVWRTDLRNNLEEQRKLTLSEALRGKVDITIKPEINKTKKVEVYEEARIVKDAKETIKIEVKDTKEINDEDEDVVFDAF